MTTFYYTCLYLSFCMQQCALRKTSQITDYEIAEVSKQSKKQPSSLKEDGASDQKTMESEIMVDGDVSLIVDRENFNLIKLTKQTMNPSKSEGLLQNLQPLAQPHQYNPSKDYNLNRPNILEQPRTRSIRMNSNENHNENSELKQAHVHVVLAADKFHYPGLVAAIT